MKNYLLFPLFALFILVSCSDDESTETSNNEPVLSSIIISSDLSSIGLGETVVFSAFTNLGLDVTSESVFFIGGSSISGNTYTFQEQGNFAVTAAYNNISSNSIVINVNVPLTTINLSSNSDTYYPGEDVVFNVVGNNGVDLTNQATISVVGGNELVENTYTTSNEGVVGFIASYEDLTSPIYEVNVLPPPTKFNQNVLIEDYTGTWCGYCPRISHAIDLVKEQTSEAVVVAIHRGSTDPSNSSYDPYNFSAGVLEDLIGLQGYPTGMLNRTTEWIYPEPNNVSQVVNLASGQADVGLALTPTLNGNTMNIDVNVKFGGQFSASNAKLVVYVLEDGLEFNQTNYTSYYGGGSVIANFEHNHVLRASLTNLLGDQIPSSEYSADNVYQLNFNTVVPPNVASTEKMSVVAVVIDGSSNAAINVRGADFGDTQTFEEL